MLYMTIHDLRTVFSMYRKRSIFLLAIPIAFAILNPRTGFFPLYMLMGTTMMLAAPEIENRDGVYRTILSAPVKRNEYVYGKFIAIVIWMIGVIASGLLINYVLHLFVPQVAMIALDNIRLMPAVMTIFLCFYMFVFFLFGEKAAKVAYYVLFFGVIFSYTALNISSIDKLAEINSVVSMLLKGNSIISYGLYLVILLAIVAILAIISAAVYEKKDL